MSIMTDSDRSEQATSPSPRDAEAQRFFGDAERRLSLWMPLLAIPICLALLAFSGSAAMGFVAGAAVAFFNLGWLHRTSQRAVSGLTDTSLTGSGARLTGASMAFGTVLRLALVTGVGYVIFRHSVESLYGYVGGLGISMLAMFAEALYEAWVAVRRGL
jgi:hypothetical protein